ncbi:MAG: NepR family anti-sigma factor [Blastomonas sp.]
MERNSKTSLAEIQELAIRTIRFNGAAARQARIGQNLRTVYDDVTRQDVPDDFAALIEKLDQRTASKTDN